MSNKIINHLQQFIPIDHGASTYDHPHYDIYTVYKKSDEHEWFSLEKMKHVLKSLHRSRIISITSISRSHCTTSTIAHRYIFYVLNHEKLIKELDAMMWDVFSDIFEKQVDNLIGTVDCG